MERTARRSSSTPVLLAHGCGAEADVLCLPRRIRLTVALQAAAERRSLLARRSTPSAHERARCDWWTGALAEGERAAGPAAGPATGTPSGVGAERPGRPRSLRS